MTTQPPVEIISVAASESPQVSGPLQINSLVINTDKVIGQGSCGTSVFEGKSTQRTASVLRDTIKRWRALCDHSTSIPRLGHVLTCYHSRVVRRPRSGSQEDVVAILRPGVSGGVVLAAKRRSSECKFPLVYWSLETCSRSLLRVRQGHNTPLALGCISESPANPSIQPLRWYDISVSKKTTISCISRLSYAKPACSRFGRVRKLVSFVLRDRISH